MRVAREAIGESFQRTPGSDLELYDNGGKAIIGAPNGRDMAYMLVQHRDIFSKKLTDFVNVFLNDMGLPCIASILTQ